MVKESAHKSIWQTTDVMIIVTLITGFILNNYIFSFPELFTSRSLQYWVGGFFVATGVSIIILAKIEFKNMGQPSGPGKPTTKVVDSGIFKFSRNPLYLGIILTLIGLGVLSSNLWYVVLSLPLGLLIHYVLIIPEERYLTELFGWDYQLYAKNVRRWL